MGGAPRWRRNFAMMADDLSALPARKIAETRGNLLEMRATLSTPEGRVEGARKLQREAESTYAEERYALALRTQLSALWLLAPGEPALPRSLAEPATPGLAALQSVICEEEQAAATKASPASNRSLRIMKGKAFKSTSILSFGSKCSNFEFVRSSAS